MKTHLRLFHLLLLLCTFKPAFMQSTKQAREPYSYCSWDNMILNKTYVFTKEDSCLFVVSTRNYNDALKEFVDYDYDTTGTLKYFAVYFKGNTWTAVPYPTLEKLLDLKDQFKDFVVFTEGLGKTFTSGVDRGTKLMRIYNIDELFFDWPTQRPYMKAGKNIKTTYLVSAKVAKPYALFLEKLQDYKNTHSSKFKTTTLFFHSMGNLILMYDLKGDLFKNIKPGLIDNVLLNAACVPQYKHAEWLNTLTFNKNTFVTINKRDRNLNGARLIFFRHQLGEKIKQPLCANVHYVNFSKVLHKEHNYYLIRPLLAQKPFLKQFYADLFEGKMPVLEYPKIQK